MNRPLTWFLLSIACLVVLPARARAQDDEPKVGLVLSGGGAKALAHIGVLEVLEELGIPIDMIAGNSMGAFVGALYALGYTEPMLEDIALTTDWAALSTDAIPRRRLRPEDKLRADRALVALPLRGATPALPANAAAGHDLFRLLARLTWPARNIRDFRQLPIPFAAVATDIETGEAVPLMRGRLPDALRASMSVPGVLSPVEIEGRALVDGLLVQNLPAREAQTLGADFLVCSDVSAPLHPRDSLDTIIEVLNQVISFRGAASLRRERERCDVLISPDITGLTGIAFDRADEAIARGRRAARAASAELRALSRDGGPRSRPSAVRTDSTWLVDVAFTGLGTRRRHTLLKALDLHLPLWVNANTLSAAIDRLRISGSFRAVTYRLDEASAGTGTVLTVRLEGSTPDAMAFGVRYESRYKASLLASLVFRDLSGFGATTDIDLRLGRHLALIGRHRRRFGPSHAFAVSAEAGWSRVPLEVFEAGRPRISADLDLWNLTLFGGVGIGTAGLVGVEGRTEWARPLAGGVTGTDPNDHYATISAVLDIDTRDRTAFPSSGVVISGRYAWTRGVFGSTTTFAQQTVNARAHVPLTQRLTFTTELWLGASSTDPPVQYEFTLGGPNRYYALPHHQVPFYGVEPQELRGSHLEVGAAELQYEVAPDIFAVAAWTTGEVSDELTLDLASFEHGFALTAGTRVWDGTLAATIGFSTVHHDPDLSVNVGLPF